MSQWDPNQVPSQENYQLVSQNNGTPASYFDSNNEYGNYNFYNLQQYGERYNPQSVNLYTAQQYPTYNFNLSINQDVNVQAHNLQTMNIQEGSTSQQNCSGTPTSNLTADAKEFQPYAHINGSNSRYKNGAVKKDTKYNRQPKSDQGNYCRNSWGNRNWQKPNQQRFQSDSRNLLKGKQRYNQTTNVTSQNRNENFEDPYFFANEVPHTNFKLNPSTSSSLRNIDDRNSETSSVGDVSNDKSERERSNTTHKNLNRYPQANNDRYGKRNTSRNNTAYNSYNSQYNRDYKSSNKDNNTFYNRSGDRYNRKDQIDEYIGENNNENHSLSKKSFKTNKFINRTKGNVLKEDKIKQLTKKEYPERNSDFKDWRSRPNPEIHGKKNIFKNNMSETRGEIKKKLDAASQRERLEEMVIRKLLECLVCCDKIRHTDEVWSCKQCYHILHLKCVIQWAKASKLDSGWRCPACQNVNNKIPKEYRCFCDKVLRPPLEPTTIPHSCGDTCGRKGRSCEHACTLLCHPGPCPDCTIMVMKTCNCGKTQMTVLCSSAVDLVCKNVCNKILDCGLHTCKKVCHAKDCGHCLEFVRQECYCGKVGRKVQCTKEIAGATNYDCGEICDKKLTCGNHYCKKLCHEGVCDPCERAPDKITTCPCMQTVLSVQRTSCLDPVPCCDKKCNKPLNCGQPSTPHQCQNDCHEGPCPPCPLTTLVRCRCGHMDRELACTELTSKADDARCEKRCTKKRQCGKHKCNQFCCIDLDHICPLICNRNLSCGLHKCEEVCHQGRCPPCWRTSFQELYCECGASVLYPPVACGTRPPPCNKLCSRPRDCGHEVNHSCHTGPCPPCTILTVRWCYGRHEQRSTIPCHQGNFSCGLPCGKDMPCGRHKCLQSCHTEDCPLPCTQPCNTPREVCSHPCNVPCHDPPCPETPCKSIVKVTCECGLRSSTRTCMDLAGEYQSIAVSQLASKMAEVQRGQTVDISDIVSCQRKPGTLKTLECTEDCKKAERNRRLVMGLQIRNPDLSSKLTPRYSDYMKSWAKKDPKFCQMVHDKLMELVQLAKQSKQKSRAHSFNSMNREKRHFIHEYCEHFGCESAAYDQEPNRNVVATAFRDKSWLPSLSLMEVVQRENGQRKVPGPVFRKHVPGESESVTLNKLPNRLQRPATPPGEYVDYFNDPPS